MSTVPDGGKVRLLDRANTLVRWLDPADAQQLIQRGEVDVLRTRRRIRAVRWKAPPASALPPGPEPHWQGSRSGSLSLRTPGLGDAHLQRLEQGCKVWRLDRLPRSTRSIFRRVLEDCLQHDEAA